MNIRGARSEDLVAIVGLSGQARSASHWPQSFYSEILEEGNDARISLVAEAAGVVRGFLIARSVSDECELESIVVAEEGRQHRIGSKLIRALMNAARDRNANRIFLEVRESNVTARSFYEACGFSIDGRRKGYYGDPAEDAVLYTLAL